MPTINTHNLAEINGLEQAAEQPGYGQPGDFDRRVAPAASTGPAVALPGGDG